MQKIKHIKLINCLGGISGLLLLTLATIIISPSATSNVSAEEIPVSVNVERYLNVALKNTENASMRIAPTIDGSFIESGDVTLDVATNNPTGYKLYMSTKDSTTALTNSDGDIIGSIEGDNVEPSNFPANHWGYRMSTSSQSGVGFSRIPGILTAIDGGNKVAETYNFNFGVKVDANKSGTYSNTLILSAVASPTEISTLSDLTFMQDMTNTICKNTFTNTDLGNPVTKQLIDTRDGKTYWVSKLADGNCWMTQNLDLDIPAAGLKAVDTDITRDWNSSSQYPPSEVERSIPAFETNIPQTTTRSWNLGKYVLITPENGVMCGGPGTPPEGNNGTQEYVGESANGGSVWTGGSLDSCKNVQDVSGAEWQPTYTATIGDWEPTGATDTTIAIHPNDMTDLSKGGTYDAHYLLGNYYQWNAATAGTGGTLQSIGEMGNISPVNATDSICPKGWVLPKSDGAASVSVNAAQGVLLNDAVYHTKYGNTFTNLLNAYGYTFPESNIYGNSGMLGQNGYTTTGAPFYFTRAGGVGLFTGAVMYLGTNAYNWSSTAANDHRAFDLLTGEHNVNPAFRDDRWHAFPVRCIAR